LIATLQKYTEIISQDDVILQCCITSYHVIASKNKQYENIYIIYKYQNKSYF